MERLQVAAACEMIGSVITLCTQLSCHSRYTKGACYVVVCVTTDLLGKHLVRITKAIASRERSFLAYAPEDSESSRLQLVKIVMRLAIHWPDKLVSVRVEVDDELEFTLVATYEVTVGLCLSF